MKKTFCTFLLLSSLCIFVGCENKNRNDTNNHNKSDYTANRTSTSISNTTTEDNQNPVENTNDSPNPTENPEPNNVDTGKQDASPNQENPTNQEKPIVEQVASEFTTQIKTKSANRANNIKLTCNKLNGTIVKAGEEFSFCKKIGVSKEADGYKKADVIVGKKVTQALGGGNCQVSTTLYNAVLAVSNLKVTERHPHGKKVNYVPEGKDAAIAHGLKDFKFKNSSDKDLKIYASSDGTKVYVKLVFLEQQ